MTFNFSFKSVKFDSPFGFSYQAMPFCMPSFNQMPLFTWQPQLPAFFTNFNYNIPSFNYFSNQLIGLNLATNFLNSINTPNANLDVLPKFDYLPKSYAPQITFDSNDYFKLETPKSFDVSRISSNQKTDLKEVSAVYNKEKGIKLAKEAIAGLSSAQKGYCARAVKHAISDAGLGAYESGNACDIPDILRKNSNFKEVKVSGNDLAKLPAGCVIAYDRGAAGYSSKYGHVEIKGEGNEAISFYVNKNIKPSDNVTVFVPV